MKKNVFLIFGILILISSFLINKSIKEGERMAGALYDEKKSFGTIEGPPQCTWEVLTPEKVISENKSQAVAINTNNPHTETCETLLYLRAPGFDLSPAKEEQKISLEASSSGSISWIITPRKTGNFEISVTDNINTKIFGINVKNMFGLTSVQAKVASFLGTLFGPMLTIPWWWDRLRKKPN